MSQTCFHCDDKVDTELLNQGSIYQITYKEQQHPVCCLGCKAVAEFIINGEQSSQYYDLRENKGERVGSDLIDSITQWEFYNDKEDYWGDKKSPNSDTHLLYLDIGGIHCSACCWLIRNQIEKLESIHIQSIDAATGVAVIEWNPKKTQFSDILETISRLGYRPSLLGDKINDDEQRNSELKRLVVAGLGMMQVMMYSVALYSGEWNGMDPIYSKFFAWVSLFVTTPVLFYSGLPFIKNALMSIRSFNAHMDIPIALAICSAYTLSCINFFRDQGSVYFDSVVMFIFFISIARFIQNRLQYRNMKTQQALVRMLPNFVSKITTGKTSSSNNIEKVPLSSIEINEELSIATGEIIPVDAILLSDHAGIEESLLTGESHLISKNKGAKLSAGSINSAQAINIQATSTSRNSTLSVLGQRLATNNLTKNVFQLKLARFASFFVISVLLLSSMTFIYWMREGQLEKGLEAALSVLVISCPCALSLAIPASLAALSHRLHKQGMHVMNSNALIQFSRAKTILFDKTGTLTELSLSDKQIQIQSDSELNKQQCLDIVVALEKNSIHPVARVFHVFDTSLTVHNFQEVKGHGVSGVINDHEYVFAKPAYLKKLGLNLPITSGKNDLHLAHMSNGSYQLLATINLNQYLRPNAQATINDLQEEGLEVQIISGDREQSVAEVASQLGIEAYLSEQSSKQKHNYINTLQKQNLVAAVGDGINDAEVLSKANISLSFTNATHIAQASADVLLSGHSLAPVHQLYASCKKLNRIVKTNISWAVTYNIVFIPLAAMGYIQPWMAALGMSLSSLFVVLNATRLSKTPLNQSKSKESSPENDTPLFQEKVT